ncbi:hypothetical protein C7378_2956 [Acidipila rosea]|uniref:BNR/Asp-box repeat protein n=1 Tax=Acidipila rosea TaxID=768535 RepID=A0A4R1L165_9BACT|nr:hypothetical protein C7378_2956 [Acidipila rosea]
MPTRRKLEDMSDQERFTVNTIYLATSEGISVVRGSENRWQGATQLEDKQVECVLADHKTRDVAFCGTFGAGLFRTSDAGRAWAPCAGFPEATVTALAAAESGVLFAGTEPSRVFRSDDLGETWFALPRLTELPSAENWSFPPRPHTHHVRAILPDFERPDDLHVAIEAGAMLRSKDAGSRWVDRVRSAPKDTHWLISNPLERNTLYSAAGDGFFQSSDDGETWQRFEQGLDGTYCWSMAISARPSRAMVMSAAKSAYGAHYEPYAHSYVYRREGNAPWEKTLGGLPNSQDHRAAVIASVDTSPGLFFLSTEGAVFRSTDDGRNWQELSIDWLNGRAKHAVGIAVG